MVIAVVGLIALGDSVETYLRIATPDEGYGVEHIKEAIRILEELHPDILVDLFAGPRIGDKIQAMIVAGVEPDVYSPGWNFDYWSAIGEGQFMSLETALEEEKAFDTDDAWGDTFMQGTFGAATDNEGHIWFISQLPSMYGWWYNKTVWDEHGWTPPETWEEAFDLFDSMKAAGMAAIANQGQWPMYLTYPTLTVLMARIAGPDRLVACFNLEPDSWTDPKIVEAFSFLNNLVVNYFQEGHLGMNHLMSQAEVMVGHAGLIGCGSWFPNEEREVWPEGAEIRATPLPGFPDSSYPQKAYMMDATGHWVINAETQHKDLAIEFLKILTSKQVSKFTVQQIGNPTTFVGSGEWLADDKFGRAMRSCAEYYDDAAYTIPKRNTLEMWYPRVEAEFRDQLSLMEDGKATPEEVCAAMQEAADKTREDPNVLMHDFKLDIASE